MTTLGEKHNIAINPCACGFGVKTVSGFSPVMVGVRLPIHCLNMGKRYDF